MPKTSKIPNKMTDTNTHNPQTGSHDFRGCKHFNSFINISTSGVEMARDLNRVISNYISLAWDSKGEKDLSTLPDDLMTLRNLRALFICTAIEQGADIAKELLDDFQTDAYITEKIEL